MRNVHEAAGAVEWNQKMEERWTGAKEHIEFVIKLYEKQMARGILILHKRPSSATSLKLEELQRIRNIGGVQVVEVDQRMYGLRTNWRMRTRRTRCAEAHEVHNQ